MDLYKILEVNRNASDDEIKRSYKKLAMKYHPDKNKSPEAIQKIQEINHAHEVLSNPDKRGMYDKFGEEGLKMGGNPFPDYGQPKQPAIMVKKNITLADLFTKKIVDIIAQQQISCNDCNSTGFSDKSHHKCSHCKGAGTVNEQIRHPFGIGFILVQKQCPFCLGVRHEIEFSHLKCQTCYGSGYVTKTETLNVPMPDDFIENPRTILKEKGMLHGGKKVDIIVNFILEIPQEYKITDNNLHYTTKISLAESLCGFQKLIDHPSGRNIVIISNPGNIINPSSVFQLPRLGFVGKYKEYPLFISLEIEYPHLFELPDNAKLTFPNLKAALDGKTEDIIYEGDVYEHYQLEEMECYHKGAEQGCNQQ